MPLINQPVGARPILVVHPARKVQRTLERVLSATMRPIRLLSDLETARAALADSPELVVIDHRALADSVSFVADATAAGVTTCIVLLGGDATTVDIPTAFRTVALSNVIAADMPTLAEELVVTALKLLRNDPFGMEKYLSWGFVPVTFRIDETAERPQAVAHVREHVSARGLGVRLATVAGQVADELLSNAIFNAPVDSGGVHYRADHARTERFELSGRDCVQLRYGCDGRYFCVEVRDNYGSLDRDAFVKHLMARTSRRLTPRDDAGGAGIGLALVHASVSHLVCNLEPGVRTELLALFDLREPMTAPGDRLASFNVFVAHSPTPAPTGTQ